MVPSVLAMRAMSVRSPGMAPIRRAFARQQSAISTVPTISLVTSVVVQMAFRANGTGTSTAAGQEIAGLQSVQLQTPKGTGRNVCAKMGTRAVLCGGDDMLLAVVKRHLVLASVIAMAQAQIVGVRMASQVKFHGTGQLHLGTAHLQNARTSRIPMESQVSAASVRMALRERSNGRGTRPEGNAHLPHARSRIPTKSKVSAVSVRMASWVTSRGPALLLRAIANQRHAMWKILPRRQDFSANAIRLHFVLM